MWTRFMGLDANGHPITRPLTEEESAELAELIDKTA